MVMCVLDDLLFSVKISTTAKRLGVDVYFERKAESVVDSVRTKRPALVIFDLNSQALKPLGAIGMLKSEPELRAIPTLGFVSHADAETIAAARQAGIDEVMARSAFSDRLPELLSRA
jgi:CheY-like chemotaxis protein